MLLYFLENREYMDVFGILYMMLAYAVVIFLTLPVHELAHAVTAHWCGDDTARWHGRLSLNPMRHLDLWGTLMILTVGIGYAKPVPVNPHNFRNYKRGTILVSLAGPLSNFLMAFVAMLLFKLCGLFGLFRISPLAMEIMWLIVDVIVSVNVSLMVFNLLPIPPLDGSRLWTTLIPGRWAYALERNSRYITMGLFVLLFVGVLDIPLAYMRSGVSVVLDLLTDLPVKLLDLFI